MQNSEQYQYKFVQNLYWNLVEQTGQPSLFSLNIKID